MTIPTFDPAPDHRPADATAAGELDYSSRRAVLVVGDGAAARARAGSAALSADMRILARLDPSEALARLGESGPAATVFVEIEEAPRTAEAAATFERLLARLDADARSGRYASVVSTPAALIDVVAALTPHARVQQLADAGALERTAALAIAAAPIALSFHDSASEDADSIRLRRLTDEVGRIAGALARLSASSNSQPSRRAAAEGSDEPLEADEIRGMIRARRMRAQYFDAELFADPAWDMLLDLMAAHLDGQRVAVSSLCIAAAVPATTALRWIKTLTDTGLFVRRADPADGRRVFIELGDDAAKGMRGYLSALRRLADAPGMGMAQRMV